MQMLNTSIIRTKCLDKIIVKKIAKLFEKEKFYKKFYDTSLSLPRSKYNIRKDFDQLYFKNAVRFVDYVVKSNIHNGYPPVFSYTDLKIFFKSLNTYEWQSLLEYLLKRHNPIVCKRIQNGNFFVYSMNKEWFDFFE